MDNGSTETISTNNRGVTTITRKKSGRITRQQIESKHGVYKAKIKNNTTESSVKLTNNIYYESSSCVKDKNNDIIKAETMLRNGTRHKLEKLTNRFGQDLHSYKLATTDASGNTSFEEISEYELNNLKNRNNGSTQIKIGEAVFFTPKAMIEMIDRN